MTENRVGGVQILAVATAAPESRYSQDELATYFSPQPAKNLRFFQHRHVQHRHLVLPPRDGRTGETQEESTGQLLRKFKDVASEIGGKAGRSATGIAAIQMEDVDFLCCVTSTGFVVPGLSAHFFREMGFRADCQRADIVGMGCNAGLNGMNVTANWCAANPGHFAMLLCVEVCSAIYCIDDSENTALVNSLFGDGAAAAIMRLPLPNEKAIAHPGVLGFSSHFIPESLDALRFDWDDLKHRYRFFISKDTPRLLASHIEVAAVRLLDPLNLGPRQVHWLIHSGGAAILDAVENVLRLDSTAFRHTRSVLRDFGNVSSASFLFSYQRLLAEKIVKAGDYGFMVTMGPGLTIESSLLRF